MFIDKPVTVCEKEALEMLKSEDEFEQFEAVKFLVTYQAKDTLSEIVNVMKKSSLAENIAAEIPYLISAEEFFGQNFEDACLVLCNIINAIPEIIPPSFVSEFGLYEVIEYLVDTRLTSPAAVALRVAKEKFEELCSNDEYLFDCDKNTKDEIKAINELLKKFNPQKLKSLFYDELYDGSDFVFFAVDFVDEIEELEELLDTENQTLILKVLTVLKSKGSLNAVHKENAFKKVTNNEIKQIIQVI